MIIQDFAIALVPHTTPTAGARARICRAQPQPFVIPLLSGFPSPQETVRRISLPCSTTGSQPTCKLTVCMR